LSFIFYIGIPVAAARWNFGWVFTLLLIGKKKT